MFRLLLLFKRFFYILFLVVLLVNGDVDSSLEDAVVDYLSFNSKPLRKFSKPAGHSFLSQLKSKS